MIEPISQLTWGEALGYFITGSIILCTVLEKVPKVISPWTTILKFIGRHLNGEVLHQLDALSTRIKKNEERADEREVIAARIRIIRFGDELLQSKLHSKDYFDQILTDITLYENYCDDHKKFRNNITELTIQHIKETYHKCQIEHKFL